MSVVGFDNVRECEKFVPALTTIKQDSFYYYNCYDRDWRDKDGKKEVGNSG